MLKDSSLNKPLVSITIPTYNSEATLALCLDAVLGQTYKNIEVNIVDGGSKDQTLEIAKSRGIKDVIICEGGLLKARYEGVKKARGDYVLLLDSDQTLNRETVERAVEKLKEGFDMLILEETSYKDKTLIEKLFKMDRKLLHQVKDFRPASGALLPRFYKKDLLWKAVNQIPKNVLEKLGGEDHLIIYWEVWQLSQRVGMLPCAVRHIEPESLWQVLKNSYRWGYTREEAYDGRYKKILSRERARVRLSLFPRGMVKESLASLILLLLKGIPGELGFYQARLTRWLKKFRL